MTLSEAIEIVDPDSGARANDAKPQDATDRFLKACRIVCAAARHEENHFADADKKVATKNRPLTLEDMEKALCYPDTINKLATELKNMQEKCKALEAERRATQENQPHGLRTIYDTPDECPYCHEHLAREWSYCPECGRPTDGNKPLTLEQLSQMDGLPVWVGEKDKRSRIGKYGLVDTVRERIVFNRSTYQTFKAAAGKTVYARRPEGSEIP